MARKRKHHRSLSPVRSPSGRLSRVGEHQEFAPTLVKRLRDAALASMQDERWGSELGRLFLSNKIESAAYAAGRRFAELAAHYHIAVGAPKGAKSATLNQLGTGGTLADPDSPEGLVIARRDRDAVERMHAANAALIGAGAAAAAAVNMVCLRDTPVYGELERIALRNGLARLAGHFGLIGPPPREVRRNGHRIDI